MASAVFLRLNFLALFPVAFSAAFSADVLEDNSSPIFAGCFQKKFQPIFQGKFSGNNSSKRGGGCFPSFQNKVLVPSKIHLFLKADSCVMHHHPALHSAPLCVTGSRRDYWFARACKLRQGNSNQRSFQKGRGVVSSTTERTARLQQNSFFRKLWAACGWFREGGA